METPGVNVNYWWFGQVVDKANWQKPILGELHKMSDVKGEMYTYKVRIIGRHDPNKNFITDKDLFNASVVLPVTAGSGHGGSSQTPNIKQGAYVAGFYSDGEDGNQPVISFILPNNPQSNLLKTDPEEGFVPRSGYFGNGGQIPISTPNIEIAFNMNGLIENADPNSQSVSKRDQQIDGSRYFYVPKTRACEGPSGPLKGIQKYIGEALFVVHFARTGILGTASDLGSILETQLNYIKEKVTVLTKTLIDSIRSFVIHSINQKLKDFLSTIEPHIRIKYSEEFTKIVDLIFCIFQKIIRRLFPLVGQLFDQIVGNFITAPICAAETFFAGMLSEMFNELTQGINNFIQPLGLSDIANNIFSGLSIVIGILEYLSCEDEIDCQMNEQWSILAGPKNFIDDIKGNIDNEIKNYTNSLFELTSVRNSGVTTGISTTASVIDIVSCNTSQLLCGPPTVTFFSNSGSGAEANAVISARGSIIGFDILSGGQGYTTPPTVQIEDGCGNGSGAVAIPIMNNGSVQNIAVIDTGAGYLPYPDGSTGGNGYVFSYPDETVRYNTKQNEYTIHECNTTINVLKDDLVYIKTLGIASVYDAQGNVLQSIIGKGPTTPITIKENGTLTTPPCSTEEPINKEGPASDNSYPVVNELEDIILTNCGFGYLNGDKIEITPANGAELSAIFDERGCVKDVAILNKGFGFTEMPKITIKSETGANANLIPLLKVSRIGDLNEKNDIIPPGTSVMRVVDCVGVVNR